MSGTPKWHLARLADRPSGTNEDPPQDFFECAIGPEDDLHVVFQRELSGVFDPTKPFAYENELYYRRGSITGRRP